MIEYGLCNPPEPIYLYVRSGEDNGESYLWYRYDIEQQQTIVEPRRGLCGKLQEIRVTSKEYKQKQNLKLDIVVQADKVYIIRSGIDTYFAKTFLLACAIADIGQPLIISVTPGENNVVFSRVYDAKTKQRYKAEWNEHADFAQIITDLQARLGQQISQSRTEPSDVDKSADTSITPIYRDLLLQETSSLLKRKSINLEDARQMLRKFYGVESRQHLTDQQLLEFRDRLAGISNK
jgi:hypothetical protein